MNLLWILQLKAIVRLELRKTFFARRGLWIYLLAAAPVVLFLFQAMVNNHFRSASQNAPSSVRRLTDEDIGAVHPGMTADEVNARLGKPYSINGSNERQVLKYPTEAGDMTLVIENDKVTSTQSRGGVGFEQETYIYAGVFQFFFIRLAVFFGCLGIFMNLIRGEMLDKTLHYYLLAPVRREILLLGKYLAGLLAAGVIFTTSAALQLFAISLAFDSNTLNRFLHQEHGVSQVFAYLLVTALACAGYGSVFLAAGLLARNPIIPAGLVLIWEAINPLLPAILQKFSVIYYLKAICPVQIPLDPGMPKLLALLASNAEPAPTYVAVLGILALSIVVIYACCRRVIPLEINYTTE